MNMIRRGSRRLNKPVPSRAHRKLAWMLGTLAGTGWLGLEFSGVVWNGVVIDGVAAATQVSSPTPPPAPANAAPQLKLTYNSNGPKQKSRTIDEGETLTIQVLAKDPNGDFVSLKASGLPDGSTWTYSDGKPATGVFSWTPAPGTADTLPSTVVTFSATDTPTNNTLSQTTRQPVTLTVGLNTPPTINPIQVPAARVGKLLKIKVVATDTDNDLLKLSYSSLPPGAKLKLKPQKKGTLTGTLTWKPKAAQGGQSFPITFTIQDSYPNPYQASEDIVIDVAAQ
jgi:hypothetical protein